MLQFMGLQRVGHEWATELNWTDALQWSQSQTKEKEEESLLKGLMTQNFFNLGKEKDLKPIKLQKERIQRIHTEKYYNEIVNN